MHNKTRALLVLLVLNTLDGFDMVMDPTLSLASFEPYNNTKAVSPLALSLASFELAGSPSRALSATQLLVLLVLNPVTILLYRTRS